MPIEENVKGIVSNFTCGHCFAQSGYDVLCAKYSTLHSTWGDFIDGKAFAIVRCRHCKMLNLLVFGVDENDYGHPLGSRDEVGPYLAECPEIIAAGYDSDMRCLSDILTIRLLGQYPYGHKLDEQVPTEIRRDLQEAANCLAISASNSAAIMCRRVIERLALSFGVKKSTLAATINTLENKRLIDGDFVAAFNEIKNWGNIGAHPKENDLGISYIEAEKIVKFTYLVVERVFYRQGIRDIASELAEMRKDKS